MCGISAYVSLAPTVNNCYNGCTEHANAPSNGNPKSGSQRSSTAERLAIQLKTSVEIIAHRGPDDSDVWISDNEQVGLAHCRLSINDLSAAGRQPLHGSDNQIHAVVNGEIYDYDSIRQECEAVHGYVFQSESDSELVLALYKIHGAPGLFTHLRGEFAFVIYDSRQGSQRVIAGRDRYGIKPLVYTRLGSALLVASEAKAFLPLGWKPRWDVRAIFDAGWMLDDRTLFRGVRKVPPGHYLDITEQGGVQQVKYWDAEYEDKTKIETRSIDEMVNGVRERLVESIRLRLRADVPIGVYLSGGIDSSAIAGIVTELSRKEKVKIGNEETARVTCFSVAFPKTSGYDESDVAERTAEWLGVKTIKKTITEDTLAEDFEDAVFHCEHHHYDLNSVAKFALSTLPREHGIKVVLTGEGSDEHFAGYPCFPVEFFREADGAFPESDLSQNHELREGLFKSAQQEMKVIWERVGGTVLEDTPTASSAGAGAGAGAVDTCDTLLAWHPTASLFAPWLRSRDADFDYRTTVLNSHSSEVQTKMRSLWHPLHTSMYMWNKNVLANVFLSCLGDRTEMAHSVEARTPFLDHHLTEYLNRLPPSVKLRYSAENASHCGELGPLWPKSSQALQSINEKWILRQAVRPYITDELYKRKKHPFLAPTKWPKNGSLHRKFKGLLTQDAIEGLGFVDPEAIQRAMETAWGETADPRAFRFLLYCGAWVTLSQRLSVAKAEESDWEV